VRALLVMSCNNAGNQVCAAHRLAGSLMELTSRCAWGWVGVAQVECMNLPGLQERFETLTRGEWSEFW
jgi:hypothetical protein